MSTNTMSTNTTSANTMSPSDPTAEGIERHPHLALERKTGHVRVDFHSHTMWSGDSTTTPDELLECVEAAALDVLCITDHNAIAGALQMYDELPCRVIVGEELRTHAGEIIGLFLTERVPQGIPPVEAAERIRDQGGLVYIPHPFDPLRNNLREDVLYELARAGLIDGVEILNGKTSLASLNARAVEFAEEFDLPGGAGSDAHVGEALGSVYLEMPDFDGPTEFLAAMRHGRAVGHHYDPPRRWRARIVPSTSES
ncbi:MAG: PHP-associated domain-containing protein [Acidimicrobiales bacterium]|jgi:predicted metal-dependent phosphoesterase TrpH